MKYFITFLIALFWSILSSGQPVIELGFKSDTSIFHEKYNEETSIHIVELIINNKGYSKEFIVQIKDIQPRTADSIDYKLLTNFIRVTPKDFSDTNTITLDIYIKVKNDLNEAENDEIILLKLSSDITESDSFKVSRPYHVISIINSEREYDKTLPSKLAIGTNFDFINGVKVNDIYSELNVFLPNLVDGIGFETSIIQYTNQSIDSSNHKLQSIFPLGNFIIDTLNNDTSRNIVLQNTNIKGITSVKVTGFNFTPTFTLPKNNNFEWYITIPINLTWEQITTKFDYTIGDSDTLKLMTEEIPDTFKIISKIPSYSYTSFTGNVGIGISMIYKNEFADIYMHPGLYLSRVPSENLYFFSYFFKFKIIENKTGIMFGCEIRNKFDNPYPNINISLSKVFDLTKLLSYM